MKKTVYEEMMEDPIFRRLMEQEDRALELSEHNIQEGLENDESPVSLVWR